MSATDNSDRIVREKERAAITGISRATWWRMRLKNLVPKEICLTDHAIGWKLNELRDWIESRRKPAA